MSSQSLYFSAKLVSSFSINFIPRSWRDTYASIWIWCRPSCIDFMCWRDFTQI